jgi:hypothetical protein
LGSTSWRAGAIALALALAAVPAAQATQQGALALGGAAAHGRLTIAVGFGSASTVVRLSGRVRIRGDDMRLLVRTCADAGCRHPAHGSARRATVKLVRGVHDPRARLRLPRAKGVVVAGGGARAVVSARTPTVTIPVEEGPSAPAAPAPSVSAGAATPADGPPPTPGPGTQVVEQPSEPAVHFDYDPSLPDAVVRCEPDQRVDVDGDVLAVKADQSFQVGDQHVRCLPADFPPWTAQRTGPTTVGLFVATVGSYVVIADGSGVPVWWMRSPSGQPPLDAKLLDAETIAWSYNPFPASVATGSYDLRGLDGRLEGTVGGGSIDFHDLQPLANGDYLAIAYVPRGGADLSAIGGPSDADVIDGEIREIRPDGTVVWRWSAGDHIAVAESAGERDLVLQGPPYDLDHINSVQDDGGGVIFSARHLDAVYRVDKATGAIDWKLGGTHTPQSLSFVDDPVGHLAGQHDARINADGTLSVHDNELFRGAPRVARYRIDPDAGTATLVSQLTDPSVPSSGCCGSARSLPDGHELVSWGQDPRIAEYDASGNPVLTIDLGSDYSYRAAPVTGPAPTLPALRAGMDAMSGA